MELIMKIIMELLFYIRSFFSVSSTIAMKIFKSVARIFTQYNRKAQFEVIGFRERENRLLHITVIARASSADFFDIEAFHSMIFSSEYSRFSRLHEINFFHRRLVSPCERELEIETAVPEQNEFLFWGPFHLPVSHLVYENLSCNIMRHYARHLVTNTNHSNTTTPLCDRD